MQILHNSTLLPYNTFGIDVFADTIVLYDSCEELLDIVRNKQDNLAKPFLHIGEGSNLLFLKDYPGTILHSKIKDITILKSDLDHVYVRVGSGWNMDEFIAYAINNGWYGIENLSNIPGQVGSSAVQNIGAYGVEIGEFIHSVNCISLQDGSLRTFTNKECTFEYRHSIFKTPEYKGIYAITSVEYKLNKTFIPRIEYGGIRQSISNLHKDINNISAQEIRDVIIEIREKKLPDPKKQGNAGSFFMNPIVKRSHFEKLLANYPGMPKYELNVEHVKIPAAWLIEQCGWKGKRHGNAGVHTQQPLVLVNLGKANGEEIRELSHLIQRDVYNKFGINIYPEVNFI